MNLENKQKVGTTNFQAADLKKEFEEELDSILNWWMENMIDEENGGFYGRIDGQGKLHSQADKAIILNSRILWTFAAASRITNNSAHKKIADSAFDYLLNHFIDPLEGGVFWLLDYKGQPLQTKKQIYAQAFTIYALSEYYLLTKNKNALNIALEIFWLIEKYSFDKSKGGYFEAFNREWLLLEDLRLSDKDANEAKTMNTHLHILEAYTNFYRAQKDRSVRAALKRLIECFLEKIIDHKTGHLKLFFDEEWNLKSDIDSYGHDIECSWLLMEAAEVLDDFELKRKVAKACIKTVESTRKEGLDTDGAVFYETKSGHKDTDKHWWPQAEAVIGFWNAWEISNKEAYLEAALHNWSFIKNFIRDTTEGEWIWSVKRDGTPDLREDKAGPWKAPYHNGRMCMELIRRLDEEVNYKL